MSSRLTEKQEQLLVCFKDAIGREQGAQGLYARMAQNCEDPGLRSVLEGFLLDEKRHEETLLERYRDLRKVAEFSD